MSRYEYLIEQSDRCMSKARETDDWRMQVFWQNAALGFRQKAQRLTIKEAKENR